ncbi:hypothetical protein EAG_13953 [Camponotus floridanus]|uniref:Uncharacterized protein n=1 Tax=Camponotus floridanus TaxID=104421 RepID=E2ABF4_CAMFO|nr:hypothetical protein EAG_13953 [Camponotus floridanus]
MTISSDPPCRISLVILRQLSRMDATFITPSLQFETFCLRNYVSQDAYFNAELDADRFEKHDIAGRYVPFDTTILKEKSSLEIRESGVRLPVRREKTERCHGLLLGDP